PSPLRRWGTCRPRIWRGGFHTPRTSSPATTTRRVGCSAVAPGRTWHARSRRHHPSAPVVAADTPSDRRLTAMAGRVLLARVGHLVPDEASPDAVVPQERRHGADAEPDVAHAGGHRSATPNTR